jgi:hypothetical protein
MKFTADESFQWSDSAKHSNSVQWNVALSFVVPPLNPVINGRVEASKGRITSPGAADHEDLWKQMFRSTLGSKMCVANWFHNKHGGRLEVFWKGGGGRQFAYKHKFKALTPNYFYWSPTIIQNRIIIFLKYFWFMLLIFDNSYPCNRPWRPTGLWDFEAPTFSRQSPHRWLWSCQL